MAKFQFISDKKVYKVLTTTDNFSLGKVRTEFVFNVSVNETPLKILQSMTKEIYICST